LSSAAFSLGCLQGSRVTPSAVNGTSRV